MAPMCLVRDKRIIAITAVACSENNLIQAGGSGRRRFVPSASRRAAPERVWRLDRCGRDDLPGHRIDGIGLYVIAEALKAAVMGNGLARHTRLVVNGYVSTDPVGYREVSLCGRSSGKLTGRQRTYWMRKLTSTLTSTGTGFPATPFTLAVE